MTKSDDPNRMVTIHAGPAWDVELLAMQLREAGIESFIPDKMVFAADPFLTGASPLDQRLQVRAVDAERGADVVAKSREQTCAGESGVDALHERDAGTDDDEDESTPREEVEHLASRTRWAAVFGLMVMGLTLPFAILTGWLYLKASRAYGIRSQAHGMTLTAFGFSVVGVVGFLLLWWGLLG